MTGNVTDIATKILNAGVKGIVVVSVSVNTF